MRRTRAESEATAAALLEQATRLFARDGYADVSLEDVAAAAGVTRGAVAHHFGTKQRLFEQVAAACQHRVGERVAAAADAEADPWDALETGCRTFLAEVLADDVRRVLLLDAPAVLGWDRWRAHDAAASEGHLAEALGTLADAGVVATGSVPATTALLSGAMNEAALWVAGRGGARARGRALEEAWTELRRLLAGLRA